MNNELILLGTWLGLVILYPMIKKGLQEMTLDITSILMIPIGLIIKCLKIIYDSKFKKI